MSLSPRQILEKLVSFPTVSRDSNLDLIAWVEDYLNSHGIPSYRMPNEDGTKAALHAQVGPNIDGGITLSGHTDVVPTEGQDWSTDPFTVIERDGKLFGRGTCDMKGFDALAISALVRAKDAPLKRPLQIALSYDEELGCAGAPPLIDHMAERLPKAAIAIIGEPSMMKVVTGHKGSISFDVHMKGFEVHSSLMHTGVNAIMEGAKIIEWANQMNEENRAKKPGPLDETFVPPWTTIHIGVISGGTAHNITAKDCHFAVDLRFVPGDDPEDWTDRFMAFVEERRAAMSAVHPDAGIDIVPGFSVPALTQETDGAAETLTRRLTGDNASHVVSYGTEAGHFQNAGYSAVICGPGDIAMAHQPNEYVTIAQLEAGDAFMDRLIAHLSD